MLPTDWSSPGGMVQSRISDPRVVQYWDKSHLIARELGQQISDLEPDCCHRKGILWDSAALFEKQAKWSYTPPVFIEGPIVRAAPAVGNKLAALSRGGLGN
jgi:hypothetical protein